METFDPSAKGPKMMTEDDELLIVVYAIGGSTANLPCGRRSV